MARLKVKLTYADNGLPLVWLTWTLRPNGLVDLRAVSLTERHAGFARQDAETEMTRGARIYPVIRVWTEKREAEHMFGATMWEKNKMALASMVEPRRGKGKRQSKGKP